MHERDVLSAGLSLQKPNKPADKTIKAGDRVKYTGRLLPLDNYRVLYISANGHVIHLNTAHVPDFKDICSVSPGNIELLSSTSSKEEPTEYYKKDTPPSQHSHENKELSLIKKEPVKELPVFPALALASYNNHKIKLEV